MFSSLLSLIPVIGPVIDGIVNIVGKFKDADIAKYKIDGQLQIEAWKAANEIAIAFRDSVSVRLARDLVMFPGSLWCGMYIWGRIWDLYAPNLVIPVKSLEGPMAFLPFALMTFFFGSAWLLKK